MAATEDAGEVAKQPPPPAPATAALAAVASLQTTPVGVPAVATNNPGTPPPPAPSAQDQPSGAGMPGRRPQEPGSRPRSGSGHASGSTRLFVGNLKSEVLTKGEFRDIWEKYGEVVEVAIHRSFGFVQFAKPESLEGAIQGEQGRMIGGKPIDLQKAKNESRRGFDRNRQNQRRPPMRQREPRDMRDSRDRGNRDERGRRDFRRRSRSRSPRRDRRDDRGGRHQRGERGYRAGGGQQQQQQDREVLPPLNGAVVTLILLGENQRPFAEAACASIRQVGIPYEIVMLDGRTLGQALRDAETNRSRYALIVGRDNARKQQVTAKMLHQREGGRCPTFDCTITELTDRIVRAERDLGFLEAGNQAQAPVASGLLGLPQAQQGVSNGNVAVNAQQSVNSLASLLQNMQNQQQLGANAPQALPLNASLNSVAQQLQLLQQQLQQVAPQMQGQSGPPPGDMQNFQSMSARQMSPQQYAPQGYGHQAPLPPPNPPRDGDNSNMQGSQISELSRLLNTLQQKNQEK